MYLVHRFLFFALILGAKTFFAQEKVETHTIPMPGVSYSFQIPGGDMAKRFGNNSNIGVHFTFKTKNNWILSAEGNFLFGDKVKEPILDSLKSSNGEIINEFGEYARVVLSERGLFFAGSIGKLIPVWGPNKNSGIMITAGAGFLQHKIRIETEGNNVPALFGDYSKGYDRLSNGFALKQFVGYLYLGKRKLYNFFIGIEFWQAFTKNRRDYNFDMMKKDDTLKKDFLYSFKFGWILPIYIQQTQKYYTY